MDKIEKYLGEAKTTRKVIPVRKGSVMGFYDYETGDPVRNEKGSKLFVVRTAKDYEQQIKNIKKDYNLVFVSSQGKEIKIPV